MRDPSAFTPEFFLSTILWDGPVMKEKLLMGKNIRKGFIISKYHHLLGLQNAVNQPHHLAIWNTPSNFAKNTENSPSKRKGSSSNHCFQFLTWLDFRGVWIYIWFIYIWYKDYIIQYIHRCICIYISLYTYVYVYTPRTQRSASFFQGVEVNHFMGQLFQTMRHHFGSR